MVAKKTALFVLLVVMLPSMTEGIAFAQDVIEPTGASGKVDWTTGVITAVGIGAPPAQPANVSQARTMAERAAQVVAYRNLLEAVKGVRIDSKATVENFMLTSEVIKTEVSGIIQGATIMDKKYMSDGSVEVTVGMKLTGALADALLPRGVTPAAPKTGGTTPANGRLYTGLIVDARGLGVRPAMAPKILSEDGKEVYGPAWIIRDFAVREGMAGYLKDLVAARTNPRVADKPLMVKATKMSGEGLVNIVISNADAAAIQSASQNLNMLEKCRVIILVD